jgi:hexokinase
MIPTYVEKATGEEKGFFMALDLGGTNFRVLSFRLKGHGRSDKISVRKFALDRRLITGRGEKLFDFIADSIVDFVKKRHIYSPTGIKMGFTFSFPVRQTDLASGVLIKWTKDFSASGVEGKDVVRLLDEAMSRKGLRGIEVTALVNDTVGTMAAKSYEDRRCDMGVILGTGTNACYSEKISNIRKWRGSRTTSGEMIVNIEWGNFNRLKRTKYDRALDRASDNPGEQILEKMVSGMYLGEIARLAAEDILKRKVGKKGYFKSEYISLIVKDRSKNLSATGRILKGLTSDKTELADRIAVKKICHIVSKRAARISAAAIAAVITKVDPALSRRHTVAIDGSVYEKQPYFALNIRTALKELFGNKSSRIRMELTKDGSGRGAAIIAAIASRRPKKVHPA